MRGLAIALLVIPAVALGDYYLSRSGGADSPVYSNDFEGSTCTNDKGNPSSGSLTTNSSPDCDDTSTPIDGSQQLALADSDDIEFMRVYTIGSLDLDNALYRVKFRFDSTFQGVFTRIIAPVDGNNSPTPGCSISNAHQIKAVCNGSDSQASETALSSSTEYILDMTFDASAGTVLCEVYNAAGDTLMQDANCTNSSFTTRDGWQAGDLNAGLPDSGLRLDCIEIYDLSAQTPPARSTACNLVP
jgi:hypothetical protein